MFILAVTISWLLFSLVLNELNNSQLQLFKPLNQRFERWHGKIFYRVITFFASLAAYIVLMALLGSFFDLGSTERGIILGLFLSFENTLFKAKVHKSSTSETNGDHEGEFDNNQDQGTINKKSKKLVVIALFVAAISLISIRFVFSVTYIPTTQNQYETVLVSRYSTTLGPEISRGSVVLVNPPFSDNVTLAKRVIGLPGDEVRIEDGKVFVNDQELVEDYIEEGVETTAQISFPHRSQWLVPEGELFLLGDDRRYAASHDSRDFGTIKKSNVNGLVIYRFN